MEIPNRSLVDLFADAVRESGDATCTIYEGEELTYQQVDDFSERIAAYLLDQGLKQETGGILLPNSPAFVISFSEYLKRVEW